MKETAWCARRALAIGFAVLVSLSGCADRPTRALLDISLADGAPAPTQLVVSVFDRYRAIADRTLIGDRAPSLPGLVIVTLPPRDQEIRVLVDGGPVVAAARVATRAGADTRAALTLRSGLPDSDGDAVPDEIDNCPTTPNPPQTDTDGDGDGDACRAPLVDGGLPDGADMTMGPPIRIWAIHPAVAPAGAPITIEGRFGAIGSATVRFPGGATAPATILGSGRLRATVPPGASVGPLTVEGDGAVSNALPFRRTRYTPQVQPFRPAYEQETHGRSMPKLTIARDGNIAEVVGSFVYVAGSLVDTRVEAARLWADGTLGAFRVAGRLTHTRFHPASVALGDHLYVIGGLRNDTSMASDDVDAATVNPDGTLTPFNAIAAKMNDARQLLRAEVIGPWLYVIGGASSSSTIATVERAPIADDGTLGAFERVGAPMITPREGHGSAVVGDFLYVFGGLNGSTYVRTVERAPILGDGSIGPFAEQPALELSSPRQRAATLVTADGVYLLGGYYAGVPLSDILRARVKPNGDLEPFATSTAALSSTRYKHAAFVTGNRVYVVGAGPNGRELEQASLIGQTTFDPAAFTDAQIPLPAERANACAAVVGDALLVVGGRGPVMSGGGAPATRTVYRAPIGADGTVGAFADTGVSLVNAHEAAGCAVVGDKLHVIAGDGGGTVETATIDEDRGTVGPFAVATGVPVPADRYYSRAIVAGDSLSLVAGDSRQILRAPINADNTLGAFTAVTDQLTVDRGGATVALFGSTLWVVGGYNPATTGFRNTTEKATVDAMGLSGMFSAGSTTMAREHSGHATVALGSQLLVIGSQYGREVEAATIAPNGASLGTFSLFVADLPWERWAHQAIVLGNWLYLVGGAQTTDNNLRRVDRAPLGN